MDSLPLAIRIIIPFILLGLCTFKPTANYLKSMDTFFHESFHALTALLLGNKVKEIRLKPNTEGVCKSLSRSKWKTFITTLAAYPLCSFLPLVLIYQITNQHVEITFLLLFIFAVAMLILYMRNSYALVWTITFASLNLLCYLTPLPKPVLVAVLYSFACLSAIGNTIACFDILKLSILSAKQSGDCALLAKLSKIPAFLWAIAFNCLNLWLVYHNFMAIFIPKTA